MEFKLFGVPFLLAALYVTIGRFPIDIAIRRTISYAITDRRILIVRSGWWRSVNSFDLARLPSIELLERSNDRGSIRFGPAATLFGNNGFGIWSPAFDPTPQFQNIDDPRSIYEVIQTTLRNAENRRT